MRYKNTTCCVIFRSNYELVFLKFFENYLHITIYKTDFKSCSIIYIA